MVNKIKLEYKGHLLKEFDPNTSDFEILDWCEKNLLKKFDKFAQTPNSFKKIGKQIIYENIITCSKFDLNYERRVNII